MSYIFAVTEFVYTKRVNDGRFLSFIADTCTDFETVQMLSYTDRILVDCTLFTTDSSLHLSFALVLWAFDPVFDLIITEVLSRRFYHLHCAL